MKILNSYKIDKKIQKILETEKGYIINGHYYDKTTMSPRALEFFPVYGDPEYLATNQRVNINSDRIYLDTKTEKTIIIDESNPSISYIVPVNLANNNALIIKIKEENGVCETILHKEYSTSLGSNACFNEYLGQDSNYLYFAVGINSSGRSNQFFKFSKISLEMTLVKNLGAYTGNARKIFENDDYIFICIQGNSGATNIYRYSKKTGEIKDFKLNLVAAGNIQFSACASIPKVVSESEIEFYIINHKTAPASFYLNKVTLNPTIDDAESALSVTECAITWGDDITAIPIFETQSYYNTFSLFVTKIGGKEYLNLSSHTIGNHKLTNNFKVHGFYTFLIDDSDSNNLTFKKVLKDFPDDLRGFVSVLDNTTVVAATSNSTYFLNFDKTQEGFAVTEILNNQPTSLGADLEGNIWVINGMCEVDMYSPTVPTQVKLSFERDGYLYEGTEIESHIKIDAFNYVGDRIEASLELTLKGNAVFTQSSTKVLTERTGLESSKQVPIKVTGPGTISVYTKVII